MDGNLWRIRERSWVALLSGMLLAAIAVLATGLPVEAAPAELTTRTNATFYIEDVASLRNGDLYIADSNGGVSRVDRDTQVESPVPIEAPVSTLATDADDNLYAHSPTTGHIYRVDAVSNAVEVIAGNGGEPTSPTGQALDVGIAPLEDMIVDQNGDLLLADPRSGWISRVNLDDGTIAPVAGIGQTGTPTEGALASSTRVAPVALAVDSAGNVYFVQIWNVVYRIDADTGVVSRFAGNGNAGLAGDHGPATDAAFYEPSGLAVDAEDNVYVGDTQNRRIRRIDAISQVVTTLVGGGEVDSPTDINPEKLEFDDAGSLLMVDSIWVRSLENPNAVTPHPSISTPGPGEITTVAGNRIGQFAPTAGRSRAVAGIDDPTALALNDRGQIVVADRDSETVFEFDPPSAVFSRLEGLVDWNSFSDGFFPHGLAFDADGNLFMSSDRREFGGVGEGYRIDRLDRSSQQPRSTFGFEDSPVVRSTSLASDSNGAIYISDAGAHRVYRLDQEATALVVVAGTGLPGFSGDGQSAANAQLSEPAGIAVLPSGDLLVADTGNNRLRIIDADTGVISTLAGDGTSASDGDGGPAEAASLDRPVGVAADGAGNIFVSEASGHRVRRIDHGTMVISTVVGNGISGSTGDGGLGIDATLAAPGPILVDDQGNLWIVETQSGVVRMVAKIAVAVELPEFEPLRQCAGVDVTIELDDGDFPTLGDDVILGTPGADVIDASWGDDIICALQGDDIVNADRGFDQVFGGAGADTIDGGIGNDKLVGGPGNDIIRSGLGNDRAFGGLGNDVINGGNGTDRLAGGPGNDVLRGDRFADELFGNQGRDQLFGGDGDDVLRGGLWIDALDGGNQSDACSIVAGEVRTNCERGVFGLR